MQSVENGSINATHTAINGFQAVQPQSTMVSPSWITLFHCPIPLFTSLAFTEPVQQPSLPSSSSC